MRPKPNIGMPRSDLDTPPFCICRTLSPDSLTCSLSSLILAFLASISCQQLQTIPSTCEALRGICTVVLMLTSLSKTSTSCCSGRYILDLPNSCKCNSIQHCTNWRYEQTFPTLQVIFPASERASTALCTCGFLMPNWASMSATSWTLKGLFSPLM